MTKKKIKRFSVMQTSLVSAIITTFISLFFSILMVIFMGGTIRHMVPGFAVGGITFIIVIPLLYGFIAFIFTAIYCLIYNWVVKWTGGIEIEVETIDSPTQTSTPLNQ